MESETYSRLVSEIYVPREPVVSGKYIIFTESGKARFTGIAFEYENYKKTYPFRRIIRKDEKGEPRKGDDGKVLDPVLFYIAEIPPGLRDIRYRIVIDGLWTTDPQNSNTAYDYANGMNVSIVPVQYYEVFQTQNVLKDQVHFTWEGTSGKTIRLAGSFNEWDPFMYEMTETSPGKYELTLPLPAGTWYYAYYDGTSQIPDTSNHNRVYTPDGRVASVVTVR
jgi:hypothetical protein